MKSKFIIFSKFSLLFVVIGFFLPVFAGPFGGNINGVQFSNLLPSSYSVGLWLIPVLAFVSIALTACLAFAKVEIERPLFFIIDFIILLALFLCVFILLYKSGIAAGGTSSFEGLLEILHIGAYLIFLGWFASLILFIVCFLTYTEAIDKISSVVIDRISSVIDKLGKKIDKLPVASQMLIGVLILALITGIGFGVFYMVDILFLDFDPIGRIIFKLKK